eukprot:scaffold224601_cov19-Tisochrysis_lutea.AAC.1
MMFDVRYCQSRGSGDSCLRRSCVMNCTVGLSVGAHIPPLSMKLSNVLNQRGGVGDATGRPVGSLLMLTWHLVI